MDLSLATTMPVMVTQTVAMFLMMAVGFVVYRIGLVDEPGSRSLTNFAVYVSMPAVILRTLAGTFDAHKLQVAGISAAITLVLLAVCMACVRVAYGARGDGIAKAGVVVSNMGFIGVPLTQAVVGEDFVFYISVSMAVQTVVIWTYSAYVITRDASVLDAKRIATNPAILAIALGFALFLLSVDLTGVPGALVDGMADMNTGLAMAVLGIYLAQADIAGLVRDLSIYKACLLRLVVTPALSILVLAAAPVEPAVKVTLLIGFICPCGTTAATLCQIFGKGDYRYAAGMVAMSTLLSVAAMPLMLMAGLLAF